MQPGLLRLALVDRRRDRKLDDIEQARLGAYRRALDRVSEPRKGRLAAPGSVYCEEHHDACRAALGENAA